MEQNNIGDAKGWVRHLKERDLSDEPSSAVEDGWLNLSVKITLISDRHFTDALPSVLRRLPLRRFPKIDSVTEVRRRGTNRSLRTAITLDHSVVEGAGRIDEIDHCFSLTTNKWCARYEVRDSRSPCDFDGGACSNSGWFIGSSCRTPRTKGRVRGCADARAPCSPESCRRQRRLSGG